MRVFTANAIIRPDHTLTVSVPADIPPGPRAVAVVLDEGPAAARGPAPLQLSPHPVGPADPASTYRREDIDGDDGR